MGNDKYLITGATGFIGSCLVRHLIAQKKQVSIIVRDKKLNWRLNDIADKLSIYESSILDTKLQSIVNKIKPDYVFHLAAYGALPQESDMYSMIDVNVKGTLNLINAVRQNRCKLFVNTGSSAEYGIKSLPMKESDIIEPINDYGVSKAASTLLCQKEAIRNNLPIITLRLFSPYGYFEEKTRLIPWIILNVLRNDSITLSSPNNVRDFIHIEDVVNAYIKAAQTACNPGEIFNIGSGTQHSVSDIVRVVLQLTKSNVKPLWGKVEAHSRQIEPAKWQADILKTKKILNWEPKNTLETGLKKTIDWFSKNKNLYS